MGALEIKELRQRTGAGILDCKKALTENDGDIEAAVDWLRAKGITKAAKKAGRTATEGAVHAYIHAGGKIGVLVEVNAETDFVARTDDFRVLVKDIAMHIAATAPEFVRREEVPAAAIAREKAIQRQRVIEEGKPDHIADRIVEGRMGKFFEDVCLLEQKFVKDDSKTVQDLLTEAVSRIGENIQIRRFTRYSLGEGLARKEEDFAAEVAAVAGTN
ncbi:MAG: translation elongation factor Ts [Deltaproteobacteria bacterium]|nr:translation elongation factor Ts [Deltaproteobacteria bacterium]MBW2253370.1 translation elongation factor Ts [Deltaproteobacteria bacterium]